MIVYNNYCLECGRTVTYAKFSALVQFALDEVECDFPYLVPCFCKSCKPDIPTLDSLCKLPPYSAEASLSCNMYPRFRFRIYPHELRDACTRMNLGDVTIVYNIVDDLLE